MKAIYLILAVLVTALSCQQKERNIENVSALFPEPFINALKAHGGLDTWYSYGTLQFDEIYNNDTLGNERYRKYVDNISFSKDRPNGDIFTALD